MEMVKFCTITLLAIIFCVSCRVHKAEARTGYHLETENLLKHLNKPFVKSIQSEDGDIVDCVDIHKQPAFDHPAMKDHVIQLRPSSEKESASSEKILPQTWQRSGSCPKGTVPIRRIRKEDLLRASFIELFGEKTSPSRYTYKASTPNNSSGNILISYPNLSVAVLHATGSFIGAQGDINVWNPKVDLPDDYTMSHVGVKGGHALEVLDAGWMVNPKLYGDNQTRFFVHWTLDGYQKTGCFDLTCSGFVHTNPQVALGVALRQTSTPGGIQYIVNLRISQDPHTGNWWLSVKHDVAVGYWPGSILQSLKQPATEAEWGGHVFSTKLKGTRPHTGTAMGSGEFSNGGHGHASYIRSILIEDAASLRVKYPENVNVVVDERKCYTLTQQKQKMKAVLLCFILGGQEETLIVSDKRNSVRFFL